MDQKKLVLQIEVPQYLREIQTAKAARPKYYYWDGNTIKGKAKKLLLMYIKKESKKTLTKERIVKPDDLKNNYLIFGFKGSKVFTYFMPIGIEFKLNDLTTKQYKLKTKYILCEAVTEKDEYDFFIPNSPSEYSYFKKVIANETKAGKPRYTIIKGQDMYSGTLNEFTRAKMVNELKYDYYKKTFDQLLENFIDFNYPLLVEMEIQDTIRNHYDRTKEGAGIRWDVGNRVYPYLKTFVDFLVNGYVVEKAIKGMTQEYGIEGIIIDDDRLHISGEGYYFTPIKEHKNRKLIFNIYEDTREGWKHIEKFLT